MTIDRMRMMLHSALMEITGQEASASMLSQLSEPNSWPLAELRAHLMERYGARSGAGLLWRIGRTYFREYLTSLEEDNALIQQDQRFLPFKRKAAEGLIILGAMLSEIHSQRITTSTKDGIHYWRIESCLECQSGHVDPGMCSFYLGFAQEFLAWIGGGKTFLVDELECISRGAQACLIVIDPTPIE